MFQNQEDQERLNALWAWTNKKKKYSSVMVRIEHSQRNGDMKIHSQHTHFVALAVFKTGIYAYLL
jgi:hypothetical protein